MKRGEVWEYNAPDRTERVRVVVISTVAYTENDRTRPICLDIVRRIPGVASPLLVPLIDPDPVGGMVDLTSIRPCNRARMTGPLGMLTGATMARVNAGLTAFLLE